MTLSSLYAFPYSAVYVASASTVLTPVGDHGRYRPPLSALETGVALRLSDRTLRRILNGSTRRCIAVCTVTALWSEQPG